MAERAHLRAVKKEGTLKVHIGCGGFKIPGYVNCDMLEGAPAAEVRFDACKPWPFATDSVSEVFNAHFIEHLHEPQAFFKEAWRCMHDNAKMIVQAPHGGHHYAWVDISHVRPWFPGSFCFLQPEYIKESRNPQHYWTHFFGIDFVECKVSPKLRKFMRWPWRDLFLNYIDHFSDAVIEFQAHLYAIKSPYTMQYFLKNRRGNEVIVMYVEEFTNAQKDA